LTITALQGNAPYGFFGGSILFKNSSYVTGVVESARIRSVIYDDGAPYNFGGGLWFETTPTPGGTLTPSLVINYQGNIGIGTTNPSIYGLGFTKQVTISNTASSQYGNLTVAGGSGASGGIDFGNQSVRHAGVYGLDGSNLGFYTNGSNSGSGLSERMRITSGGDVGIGTTSPNVKLRVEGSTILNGAVSANTTYNAFALNVGGIAYIIGGSVWVNDAYGYANASSVNTGMYPDSSHNITFKNNNSTSVYINSSRNVGIGTTSPFSSLDVSTSSTGAICVGTSSNTISSGDLIGAISFVSRDGTTYSSGGVSNIRSYATETYNSSNVGADLRFYTTNAIQNINADVLFGTERMRITNEGDIIIGYNQTTAVIIGRTFATTHASGNRGAELFFGIEDGGNGGMYVYNVASSVAGHNSQYITLNTHEGAVSTGERMRITSTGDVLVNATSTTQGAKFYVNGIGAFGSVYVGALGTGTVYSNAGFLTNTNPSDRRLKTSIIPLTYGLSDILKLNPVSYNWKDGTNGKQFGFIAQEVQEIMPDAVKQGEYLGLEKDAIYSALVNAIKEQQAQINELKSQIK
jgi:hypothetical protein